MTKSVHLDHNYSYCYTCDSAIIIGNDHMLTCYYSPDANHLNLQRLTVLSLSVQVFFHTVWEIDDTFSVFLLTPVYPPCFQGCLSSEIHIAAVSKNVYHCSACQWVCSIWNMECKIGCESKCSPVGEYILHPTYDFGKHTKHTTTSTLSCNWITPNAYRDIESFHLHDYTCVCDEMRFTLQIPYS